MGEGSPARDTQGAWRWYCRSRPLAGWSGALRLAMQPGRRRETAAATQPTAPEPQAAPEPQVAPAPRRTTREPKADAAAEPTAASPAEAEAERGAPAVAAAAAPGFDVVRVEPDGSAAVAGTAAPGRQGDDLRRPDAARRGRGRRAGQLRRDVPGRAVGRAAGADARCDAAGAAARRRSSDDVVMLLPQAPGGGGATPEPAAVAPQAPAGATGRGRRGSSWAGRSRDRAEAAERRRRGAGGGAGGGPRRPRRRSRRRRSCAADTVEVLPAAGDAMRR